MSKGLEAFNRISKAMDYADDMATQYYEVGDFDAVEKELKAFQVLKKLFHNPNGYSMLALVNWQYPDVTYRIESTDDSWIHEDISQEEFELLKDVFGD